ncbi:hypothetical protein QWZ04_23060 [Vibrio tapetis subsp. quintayensis]|uniref:hypothetical protein n=1 Tax=Vibrio tapetis TaxID=52443 RepID=UPI0025B4511E|nr:hypothetical protein [Vibrio tapetis]MDN3683191.1 hypothetical protein [Vibrio tapetis subsp. quintayensis]
MAEKAREQSWSAERYLAELCRLELDSREEKRLQRHLKESNLPAVCSVNKLSQKSVI